MDILIAIMTILGFIVALFSWAWILQSIVVDGVVHWKTSNFWIRLLFSALMLLGLLISLQSLSKFNKYFTFLVDRYIS